MGDFSPFQWWLGSVSCSGDSLFVCFSDRNEKNMAFVSGLQLAPGLDNPVWRLLWPSAPLHRFIL